MHGITEEPGDRKKLISPGRLDACPSRKEILMWHFSWTIARYWRDILLFFFWQEMKQIYHIYIYTIFFTWCLDIVQYSKLLTQSLLLLVFVWSGSPFSNATTGRGKTFDDFQMPRFRRSVAENRRELLTGIQSHCQRKKEVRSEVSPKSDT